MQDIRFLNEETGEQESLIRKFFKEDESTDLAMERERIQAQMQTLEKGQSVQVKEVRNIKRKDPCPCGSGKKFKNCCISKIED